MPGSRRQARRQGVVYGPPRQPGGRSENGVLIGRFLGLGILLLTMGLLAAGALAFVNDQPPAQATAPRTNAVAASLTAVPSRTASASRTASPSTSPGLPATAPPSSPPTAPVTSLPPPTLAPPLVQIGEGYVTFGTAIDDQLHIQDPRSTFTFADRIVWSARLTRRADSIDLVTQVLKADPAAVNGLRVVYEEAVTPLVQNAQLFSRRVRPEWLEGEGVYTVRYIRGDTILSEGAFLVTA